MRCGYDNRISQAITLMEYVVLYAILAFLPGTGGLVEVCNEEGTVASTKYLSVAILLVWHISCVSFALLIFMQLSHLPAPDEQELLGKLNSGRMWLYIIVFILPLLSLTFIPVLPDSATFSGVRTLLRILCGLQIVLTLLFLWFSYRHLRSLREHYTALDKQEQQRYSQTTNTGG